MGEGLGFLRLRPRGVVHIQGMADDEFVDASLTDERQQRVPAPGGIRVHEGGQGRCHPQLVPEAEADPAGAVVNPEESHRADSGAGAPAVQFHLRRGRITLALAPMPPRPELSPADLARYGRHLSLAEIGLEGQRKLAAARILVVGAGGLGSPAALYLAAAGVGTLGIADFDQVERHNLQRQLLHEDGDVGAPKVESALRRLRAVNPGIRLNAHPEGVVPGTALALFSAYDVIVDGTDTFDSRYLNNDAAVLTGRPLVHGNVFRFDGQLSVFDPARGGPCYRCLFPEPPPAGAVPSCGEAGVLGALCGVIGSLQALEAIKLVTGAGEPLRGRLLAHDALAQRFQVLTLARDPACAVCGQAPVIRSLEPERYAPACAAPLPASAMPDPVPLELSVTAARDLVRQNPDRTRIIDVREPHELEICRLDEAEHIPMRRIPERIAELPRDRHLLILCHHGSRSLHVTRYLRQQGFETVSNIAGGIEAWAAELDPTLARY